MSAPLTMPIYCRELTHANNLNKASVASGLIESKFDLGRIEKLSLRLPIVKLTHVVTMPLAS